MYNINDNGDNFIIRGDNKMNSFLEKITSCHRGKLLNDAFIFPNHISTIEGLENYLMSAEFTKSELTKMINSICYSVNMNKKVKEPKASLVCELLFTINDDLGCPFDIVDRRSNSLFCKKIKQKTKIKEIALESAKEILKKAFIKALNNENTVDYIVDSLNEIKKSKFDKPVINTALELMCRKILGGV